MPAKLRKISRSILSLFYSNFDIQLLFKFCIQVYQKQSPNMRKKYDSLLGMLQLSQARIIQYQKQQSLLKSGIALLQQCLSLSQPILSYFSVDQLTKMLQVLCQWKKMVQHCLCFLKQVAQPIWKELKTPLIAHISKYYNLIQSFLHSVFCKTHEASKPQPLAAANLNHHETIHHNHLRDQEEQLNIQAMQNPKKLNQTNFVSQNAVFSYKANSITLCQKQKRYPIKVSKPQPEEKREIKSVYATNLYSCSQKITGVFTQNEALNRINNIQKLLDQKDSIPSSTPDTQIVNNGSVQKATPLNAKRNGKFLGRHKSNIQSQINMKVQLQKHLFNSSNRLQEATIFTTNPYETTSQVTYTSNSRTFLKSTKNNGKSSLSKHRMSKNTFRKSLIQNFSSKKTSENKANIASLPKEEQLQEVDQSKHNMSDTDHNDKHQPVDSSTQQNFNLDNEDLESRRFPEKGALTQDFFSSKSFKNQRYRRRLGQSNNIANSLRSLDKIESFLSGSSKQEIKKIKNQSRPSFFRSEGVTFDEKSKTVKSKVSKMSAAKLKLFDKNQKQHQEIIHDSEYELRRDVEKPPRRFHTQSNQNNYRTSTADIKQCYQILTEINLNQQSQYNQHPEHYHQLFKRKYSNNQSVFDYDQHARPKPFKIKMETAVPVVLINRPNVKKEALYFEFMHSTIKNHEALTLGQRGLSECY